MPMASLNGPMQDPLGLVVSVTEHMHHFGRGSLRALDGEGFILGGQRYESLWLDGAAYQVVNGPLFPEEPDLPAPVPRAQP